MKRVIREKYYYLIIMGLVCAFGSLSISYLDAVGYFGKIRDFQSAFFADRSSELGMGGVQLFHYFIIGTILNVRFSRIAAAVTFVSFNRYRIIPSTT